MKPHSPSGVDALVFSTSDVASEMAATYLRLSSTLKLLLMKLAALEPNSLSLSVAAFFSPKFEHPGEDANHAILHRIPCGVTILPPVES